MHIFLDKDHGKKKRERAAHCLIYMNPPPMATITNVRETPYQPIIFHIRPVLNLPLTLQLQALGLPPPIANNLPVDNLRQVLIDLTHPLYSYQRTRLFNPARIT